MVQSGVNHPIKLRFCNLVKQVLIAGRNGTSFDSLVDPLMLHVNLPIVLGNPHGNEEKADRNTVVITV
jgi:RNAse (barnase) inhibitor barstar